MLLCKGLGWPLHFSKLKAVVWFMDLLLLPLNWGPASLYGREGFEILTYYRPQIDSDTFGGATAALVCSHPDLFSFLTYSVVEVT